MTESDDRSNNVVALLAIEGMQVTESEKVLASKCMIHEISYDEAIASFRKIHTWAIKVISSRMLSDTLT